MLLNSNTTIINVESAIARLRCGLPVLLSESGERLVIQAVSATTGGSLEAFSSFLADEDSFLVLTKTRGQILYPGDEVQHSIKIPLDGLELSSIKHLSAIEPDARAEIFPYIYVGECSTQALELAKYAEIIPALLACRVDNCELNFEGILEIKFSDVRNYQQEIAKALTPICTAPLTLKHAPEASITVFRAVPGTKEHYAITIGKPSENSPIVRVHSSCFTGDLLGSLKCDCGDQLQQSMEYMHAQGGGIILYMIQEGRGIGLVNKLRAYGLQNQGMDTVEANEFLGFDDDERPYLSAASMLKKMGYHKIKLMTNNPRKVKSIEECDIEVEQRVPLIVNHGEHNKGYLETKFSKLGHISNGG